MRKTNTRRVLIFGVAGLAALATAPVRAQIVVYDPASYVQNVLQAARALQQINNQITSLQNQAMSLINEAKNLASLPFSALGELQKAINQTKTLISQAQNIAYQVQSIDDNFKKLYSLDALMGSDKTLIENAQNRWKITVGGLQDSMRVQAQVLGNLSNSQTQMSSLVGASQSASGALAATQAGNQILAVQSQQLADLITLLAAQGRAQDIKAASDAATAAQMKEQRRRFLTRTHGYEPGNAKMFYGD